MSVSINIKKEIIRNVQNCPSVQKVFGYEQFNPDGWPAVFVKPLEMEGEFSSNAENSRVYSYSLLILFPVGQEFKPPNGRNRLEYSEEVVGTVIDEIINISDTDFELTDSDPTVLFVNAANLVWGDYEYEGGVAKAALLTLRVYTELVVV